MQAKTATKAKTAIQASQPRCYARRLTARPRGWFVEHLGWTKATQQSVTKFIAMIFMNVVTPKATAKNQLCSTNWPLGLKLTKLFLTLQQNLITTKKVYITCRESFLKWKDQYS